MNKTMLIDYYEFTMAMALMNNLEHDKITYFDAFFRRNPFDGGYSIMAGGDEIIDHINNLHFTEEEISFLSKQGLDEKFLNYLRNFKFTGDLYMIPDGTPVFPNEPLITVKANFLEAAILETALLSYLNGSIKYATAAKRVVEASGGIPVMEFGARRADGIEASLLASKFAYMCGCMATSNTEAGYLYDIPVSGTMAHSWVELFDTEYEAFLAYAKAHPNNTVLLLDTYDVLNSGLPNAIRVAKEYLEPHGYFLKGIRIDSGDLTYLSQTVRTILDENNMKDTQICLSNSISPQTLENLRFQGAKFDSLGIGDHICAPKDVVGCVYKLVATSEKEFIKAKIKVSNDMAKTINPGYKKTYRFFDRVTGYALGDVIARHDEVISQDEYTLVDSENELNQKTINNYVVKELQELVFKDGKQVYKTMDLKTKREYCEVQMKTLYPEILRLEKPHGYYVDLSETLLEEKKQMIKQARQYRI